MQSFPLVSGDEVVLDITVKDNADAVVDLNGASVRFAAARSASSTPDLDSAASPATATAVIQDAPNGLVRVTISDDNSEALIGDYYYECKVTDAAGQEAVVARGWMSFAENLT